MLFRSEMTALANSMVAALTSTSVDTIDGATGAVQKYEGTAAMLLKPAMQTFENGILKLFDMNAQSISIGMLDIIGKFSTIGDKLYNLEIPKPGEYLEISTADMAAIEQYTKETVAYLASIPEEQQYLIASTGLNQLAASLRLLSENTSLGDNLEFTNGIKAIEDFAGVAVETAAKTTEAKASAAMQKGIQDKVQELITSRQNAKFAPQIKQISSFFTVPLASFGLPGALFTGTTTVLPSSKEFVSKFKDVMITDAEGRTRSILDILLSDEELSKYMGNSPEVQAIVDYWQQISSEMPMKDKNALKALYVTGPAAVDVAKTLIESSAINPKVIDTFNNAVTTFNKKLQSGADGKTAFKELLNSPLFDGKSLATLMKTSELPSTLQAAASELVQSAVDAGIIDKKTADSLSGSIAETVIDAWTNAGDTKIGRAHV